MSRGKNLQEMETGTKQSKTAVNANASAAEPMHKLAPGAVAGKLAAGKTLVVLLQKTTSLLMTQQS